MSKTDTIKEEAKENPYETQVIVLSPVQRNNVLESTQEVAHAQQALNAANKKNQQVSELILDAHGIKQEQVLDAQVSEDATQITLTLNKE